MSDLTPQQIIYFFQKDAATQANPSRADVYSQTWKLIEQQQARIAELEKYNLALATESHNKSNRIKQLKVRISELEATVERFKRACNENIMDWVTCGMSVNNRLQEQWAIDILSELRQALKTTPSQNLNSVKREAWIKGYQSTGEIYHGENTEYMSIVRLAAQRYPDKE